MDKVMESKPLPVCFLPCALNIKSQLSVDCPEAAVVGRDKGEAKAAADGHSIKPTFGTMKMQTFDVCHKIFVIFDHCEGQNTVFLHPSWLHSLPHQSSVEPGSMWEVNHFLGCHKGFNSKCKEAMFGFHSHEALSPALGDARRPALEVQQKSCNVQKCGLIGVASYEAHNLKKQVLETRTHMYKRESFSSKFRENTEEINALLSLDDELSSTGHSPSDGASYCYSETMNGPCTNIAGRKRKREDFAEEEVDDADSGSGKLAPDHTPLVIGGSESSNSLQFLIKSNLEAIRSDVGCGNPPGKNTISYVSEQVNANQHQRESSHSPGERGPEDSSERIKIEGIVQQLRNVIPGGNLLDTAGVLGRTIHYVKCLQNKLRGLEAARESAMVTHQIG